MSESTRRELRQRAATPSRRRHLASDSGTMPGTLPPPDPDAAERRRITVIAYTSDAVTETEGKTLEEALAVAGPGVRWINVDGPDTAVLQRLGAHFKLHPLALESARTAAKLARLARRSGNRVEEG